MVRQSNDTNRKSWVPNYALPAWIRRSRYYLMEFIAGLVGLAVTSLLLDRALFALASYLNDSETAGVAADQMNLWVVAMLVVALPLTLLFYKRSRFEELERPVVATTKLRRFFLYVFMLGMLWATAAFAVWAIYQTLLVLFGAAEAGDTLLKQTAPAVVAAGLHGCIFKTFMKTNTALRLREFGFLFGIFGLVVLVALLVMTSIQARSTLVDQKTSKDLEAISQKVDEYYRQNSKLPAQLGDLSLDGAIEHRAERHGYSYEKRNSYGYKLCADFKAPAHGQQHSGPEMLSAFNAAKPSIYPPIPSGDNFFDHGKGRHCFDVTVGARILPAAEDADAATGSTTPNYDALFPSNSRLY